VRFVLSDEESLGHIERDGYGSIRLVAGALPDDLPRALLEFDPATTRS
jgi:hypothetical protein